MVVVCKGVDADSLILLTEEVEAEPFFAEVANKKSGASLVVVAGDDAHHFDFVIAEVRVDNLVAVCTEFKVDSSITTAKSEAGSRVAENLISDGLSINGDCKMRFKLEKEIW